MLRRLTAVAALALPLAAAACGSDAGAGLTSPDGELTPADLAALNLAILRLGSGVATGNVPTASRAPGGLVAPDATADGVFSFTLNTTVACVPTGEADLDGTVAASWSADTGEGQLQTEFAIGHRDCAVASEGSAPVVITGDPDIDVRLTASSVGNQISEMQLTEAGAFQWRKGDGSGRCEVDLTATWVPSTDRAVLAGHFCGWRVDGVTVPVD